MMDGSLVKLFGAVTIDPDQIEGTDRTSQRILDAAVQEAATVGLQRLTVEDVVRRAGVARMTVYRRYPRRDDLVEALVRRETQRFLTAVAEGIDEADDEHDGVVAAFIAAVRFSRAHPMLQRAAYTESALSPAENAELLDMGAAFIARHIHGDAPGQPSQQARWVADVFARLFMTYIATPPTDPDFGDDTELRRFAHAVLTPMVERAVSTHH
jgi:TetR/AcrR family transcriptional regulator, repressor for uid operon